MAYDVGDLVRCIATFTASGGGVAIPASVFFLSRDPAGAVTTWAWPASVFAAASGAYYADVIASQGGDWHARFVGIPDKRAAVEFSFNVRHSSFAL